MKQSLVIGSIATCIITALYLLNSYFVKDLRGVYRKNIQSLVSSKLEGPEKSKYRDAIMTMNPETGQFNFKEISRLIRDQSVRRLDDESRDFKWSGISTEIAGRTRAMMIDPNNAEKLWAGGVTGGLWYTNDFRNNSAWEPVSDNWESLSISCITHDPLNTDIFYVGTGESYTSVNTYRESTSAGVGIYVSTDAGSTWTLLQSTSNFDYVNDIVIRDEAGTSVIYAAVASGKYQGKIFNSTPSDGLFRSTDGGSTWTQVLPNIPNSSVPFSVADIELSSSNRLFIGTMRNLELKGGGYLLYSDNGIDWSIEEQYRDDVIAEALNDYGISFIPGRVLIKSAPSNGSHLYAIATGGWLNSVSQIRDHSFFTRIMQSFDNGQNWEYLDGPNDSWASIPWHALAMDVDPNNENKIVIGGLETYALQDATSVGALSWIRLSEWSSMFYFSEKLISYYELTDVDSILNHFVHADIHDIQFIPGSSDEVLFATDGGLQFTTEMSNTNSNLIGDRLESYPSFHPINNGLGTTQYYTVALRPEKGNDNITGGAQDNSSHFGHMGQQIMYDALISGGDGAYCFFDRDNPNLLISSSQTNSYNIFVGDQGYFANFGQSTGTFINPSAYDDRSNLLYCNLAVDGGFELLIPGLTGKFLDSLGIINVNQFLGTGMLGLDGTEYIKLGTNSTSAFSELTISPHDPATNATLIVGNQFGDIYLVKGLPIAPVSKKIDNDQLPVGYVSSIAIGDTNNDILVTFSNYGVQSVWYTGNGGLNWTNLERNLPDIPVRDGIFNPLDDQQIIIATELGIWGLENISDPTSEWQSYNYGFPNVRVDMIRARASDSVIVAATHGRGLFKGKFVQAPEQDDPLSVHSSKAKISVYPNPAKDQIRVLTEGRDCQFEICDITGKRVMTGNVTEDKVQVSNLKPGLYILNLIDRGDRSTIKLVIEN